MTFHQFIEAFERRNPGVFEREMVRLKPETLRSLLRQAHDAGQKSTAENASPYPPSPFKDLFGGRPT